MKTEHRYFVRSPERVIAVVTRGGDKPGALYVHADNLGSVDALTNEGGGVEERRSYDAFGQRRNSVWGQPPPASFSSKITIGFTGHESDDELGLVNMKGRLFDPKLGRFMTPDPIISDLYDGQSLNAYSYVTNNPLAFVDPTGFSEEPAELLPGPNTQLGQDGALEIVIRARPAGEKEWNDTASAAEVGAAAPPTDVDTTGSSPEYDPHAETTASDEGAQEVGEDWTQHSLVQVEGGFLGGLGLGMVPFGGAIANAMTDPGTQWAEIGKAVGEIFGGGFGFAAGVAGIAGGGAASGTGVLTLPGVALVVGSAALAAGGIANVKAGADRLGQALSMSSGSGSGAHVVRVGGRTWKAFEPGAKACQSGCNRVAKAIQKAIGGEIKIFRSSGKFLGKVRNSAGEFVNPAGDLAQGWKEHHVVVKDGKVYDAFTGPNGLDASSYKQLWEYSESIDFGF